MSILYIYFIMHNSMLTTDTDSLVWRGSKLSESPPYVENARLLGGLTDLNQIKQLFNSLHDKVNTALSWLRILPDQYIVDHDSI